MSKSNAMNLSLELEWIGAWEALEIEAFNCSKDHGFHENYPNENDAEKLALIHSEISEVLEAIRHHNPPDSHIPEFSGAEAELADAVIRIMDFAKAKKWKVPEAVVAKMNYNRNRPYKHGGKAF